MLQLVEQAARQAAAGTPDRLAHSCPNFAADKDKLAITCRGTHFRLSQQQPLQIPQTDPWQSRESQGFSLQTNSGAPSASFASSSSVLTPTDVLTAPSAAASPPSGASFSSSSPSLRRTSSAIANYQAVGLPSFQDLLQSYRKNLGSVTTAVGRLTQVGHDVIEEPSL